MKNQLSSINHSIFRPLEIKITKYLANYVPSFIGTKTLTFITLFCSLFVFLSYFLSKNNKWFFLIASFWIVMQWIFDCLDGTIGRMRNQGFVRWGFYMDHFFDYFFMASIILGWLFVFPNQSTMIWILFLISSAFMMSFILIHDATKDLQKDLSTSFMGFSPIEFRLLIIFLNVLFLYPVILNIFSKIIIYLIFLLLILLVVIVYHNQKKLHEIDMNRKNAK
ncbi:MAG: CDP-alcohol phosphatidyltransferase family protein [Candidatus Woesearchaeota archaeon]